jgi:hypothetical protein
VHITKLGLGTEVGHYPCQGDIDHLCGAANGPRDRAMVTLCNIDLATATQLPELAVPQGFSAVGTGCLGAGAILSAHSSLNQPREGPWVPGKALRAWDPTEIRPQPCHMSAGGMSLKSVMLVELPSVLGPGSHWTVHSSVACQGARKAGFGVLGENAGDPGDSLQQEVDAVFSAKTDGAGCCPGCAQGVWGCGHVCTCECADPRVMCARTRGFVHSCASIYVSMCTLHACVEHVCEDPRCVCGSKCVCMSIEHTCACVCVCMWHKCEDVGACVIPPGSPQVPPRSFDPRLSLPLDSSQPSGYR